MSLLQEYRNERARTEWHVSRFFYEEGIDRRTMVLRAELSNRWQDFRHAFGNWREQLRAKLMPQKYALLVETTEPGEIHRTYEARHA